MPRSQAPLVRSVTARGACSQPHHTRPRGVHGEGPPLSGQLHLRLQGAVLRCHSVQHPPLPFLQTPGFAPACGMHRQSDGVLRHGVGPPSLVQLVQNVRHRPPRAPTATDTDRDGLGFRRLPPPEGRSHRVDAREKGQQRVGIRCGGETGENGAEAGHPRVQPVVHGFDEFAAGTADPSDQTRPGRARPLRTAVHRIETRRVARCDGTDHRRVLAHRRPDRIQQHVVAPRRSQITRDHTQAREVNDVLQRRSVARLSPAGIARDRAPPGCRTRQHSSVSRAPASDWSVRWMVCTMVRTDGASGVRKPCIVTRSDTRVISHNRRSIRPNDRCT